jgi:hypothetical protein
VSEPDDPVVVFTGTAWQTVQLQGLLESAGIASFLRDEVMGRIDAPALAAGAIGAVKLVVTREHVPRAEEVLRDFGGEKGMPDPAPEVPAELPPLPPWVCVHCGEQVEGQFDTCWSCGAARGD